MAEGARGGLAGEGMIDAVDMDWSLPVRLVASSPGLAYRAAAPARFVLSVDPLRLHILTCASSKDNEQTSGMPSQQQCHAIPKKCYSTQTACRCPRHNMVHYSRQLDFHHCSRVLALDSDTTAGLA